MTTFSNSSYFLSDDYYGYPFQNVHNQEVTNQQDLIKKSIFRFRSPKSKQTYLVHVEYYRHNVAVVKYHLKTHRLSEKKYNILTGLYEARTVIKTCINIMLQIAYENEKLSFGFIGAHTEKKDFEESKSNTKRFRVYQALMSTYFSEDVYEHYTFGEQSAYLLLNKWEYRKDSHLLEGIAQMFKRNYPELHD
jgi:hypothetical protein